MTDATTHQRLRVSTDSTGGPYITVPVSQLEDVKQLLDARRIRYWVDENAISLNGEPEVTVINLGREADGSAVQGILDGAEGGRRIPVPLADDIRTLRDRTVSDLSAAHDYYTDTKSAWDIVRRFIATE